LSDLGKETQNPFLDTRIRIWIFPKKRTLSSHSNNVSNVCRKKNKNKTKQNKTKQNKKHSCDRAQFLKLPALSENISIGKVKLHCTNNYNSLIVALPNSQIFILSTPNDRSYCLSRQTSSPSYSEKNFLLPYGISKSKLI